MVDMESGLAAGTFCQKIFSLPLSISPILSPLSFLLTRCPVIKQRFQFVSLVFIWGHEMVCITINMGSQKPCTIVVCKPLLHWDSDHA